MPYVFRVESFHKSLRSAEYACLGRYRYKGLQIFDAAQLGDFVNENGQKVEEVVSPVEEFLRGCMKSGKFNT